MMAKKTNAEQAFKCNRQEYSCVSMPELAIGYMHIGNETEERNERIEILWRSGQNATKRKTEKMRPKTHTEQRKGNTWKASELNTQHNSFVDCRPLPRCFSISKFRATVFYCALATSMQPEKRDGERCMHEEREMAWNCTTANKWNQPDTHQRMEREQKNETQKQNNFPKVIYWPNIFALFSLCKFLRKMLVPYVFGPFHSAVFPLERTLSQSAAPSISHLFLLSVGEIDCFFLLPLLHFIFA